MIYEKINLKDHFEFLGADGKNPTLELFLPYNLKEMGRENEKRPCMIVCPGGGYACCSEREAEPIALNFLNQGFNAFILTYSVAPHRFPTQLCEVAAVMELIYKNADNWNCDTSKIAIIGFSAGGHLVAHYSTMFDCKEVREIFPESKSVNASVLCYPVISADEKVGHTGTFENLLGHKPQNKAEEEYFSCDCQVTANTPPAFIWHTVKDELVPVQNSILYANALADNNVPFELHIYPEGPHGLATCDSSTYHEVPDCAKYAADWLLSLKKWLKLVFEL